MGDIDLLGEYTVEAFIAGTAISATTVVTVFEEMDEIVDLELEADEDVLMVPDTTELTVTLTDEYGIEKEITTGDFEDEDIVFSSSAPSVATVSREGIVLARDEGSTTITAIHLDSGLEDSIEIFVSGDPVTIDVEWDYEVGELEGVITMTYLDEDGFKAREAEDEEGYRVITPAGVTAVDEEDFEDGVATFGLQADDFGTYTVRVVTDEGISKNFEVTFTEEPIVPPVAEQVEFFIGETIYLVDGEAHWLDVPAFIEDGRTFIPVRFLAEALGAEADWGPKPGPVEWVSFEDEERIVSMNIGEFVLTILCKETGETEEVVMDVAAMIKDGRTFLPFRAVAEAFGAEVDYEEGEEGYVTRVWFTQERYPEPIPDADPRIGESVVEGEILAIDKENREVEIEIHWGPDTPDIEPFITIAEDALLRLYVDGHMEEALTMCDLEVGMITSYILTEDLEARAVIVHTYTEPEEPGPVCAENSSVTFEDQEDGTAIATLYVYDEDGVGISGYGMEDIEVLAEDLFEAEWNSLVVLDEGEYVTITEFADHGDGTYTYRVARPAGELTLSFRVDGVVIQTGLQAVITQAEEG